jgi:hypothetical protein
MQQRPTGKLSLNEDGNPWNNQAVNCRFRGQNERRAVAGRVPLTDAPLK